MYILGISAFYHDSAAALLKDGVIIAVMQEERFTRIKHDDAFPVNAVNKCLESENITIDDIEIIAFYEKPFLKFERIINTNLQFIPFGFIQFQKAMSAWLKKKLWIPNIIEKELGYKGKIIFTEHHESHAASSFYSSSFKDAAILTIDGVGEWATTTIGAGNDENVEILLEQHFPHSLGLLYSAFTYYCGFKVNSGEYKLMGLAPYGKPLYKEIIETELITINTDGSFQLNMNYFSFPYGNRMINKKFNELFDCKPRIPESEISQFYKDIAASIQSVTEDIILLLAKRAKEITGKKNICLAGGVALNCKSNQKLIESNLFDAIYIQPASGDAGGCIGAAYIAWYKYLGQKRNKVSDAINEVNLGNEYDNNTIELILKENSIEFTQHTNEVINTIISKELLAQKVIGWFSGRMEFGPRALGNRSILADPRNGKMKDIINEKIKLRENFRPFAPAIMEELAKDYFEIHTGNYNSMMFTSVAKPIASENLKAVVHNDNTSRIQIVSKSTNKKFHSLLTSFYELTGCPVLINTSFNVRGEPLVESPIDALRCFFSTDMDILVLENFIIRKNQKSEVMKQFKSSKYELD